MNRSILNFEAVIHSQGLGVDNESLYVITLYVNHHPIVSWNLGHEGYLMSQDRAHLDQFVALKLWAMLHPDCP